MNTKRERPVGAGDKVRGWLSPLRRLRPEGAAAAGTAMPVHYSGLGVGGYSTDATPTRMRGFDQALVLEAATAAAPTTTEAPVSTPPPEPTTAAPAPSPVTTARTTTAAPRKPATPAAKPAPPGCGQWVYKKSTGTFIRIPAPC